MAKLIDENNEEITDTKDILEFQKRYYENSCKDQIKISDDTIQDMIGENENKLTDQDSKQLEGEITLTELSLAVKNMKNSKSPGSDGFTAEFFFLIFLEGFECFHFKFYKLCL